uniref:Uncharacterized protein n=1 Tax=Aegilops tauschii subsp. strangulata TaxID=200361 RepID=A0A453GTT9_AEGTS
CRRRGAAAAGGLLAKDPPAGAAVKKAHRCLDPLSNRTAAARHPARRRPDPWTSRRSPGRPASPGTMRSSPRASPGCSYKRTSPSPPPTAQIFLRMKLSKSSLILANFYDDELPAALVEYQAHRFLSEPHGPDVGDGHFGEGSGDDITREEFVEYCRKLKARRPAEIDAKTGLNQEQLDSLLAKYKRYRFKAYLLLLGKPVEELEEAALESKYPMELAMENEFFYPCLHDSTFGWYFDSDLCLLANLSDYQRLVLPNCGVNEYEYERWSQYKAFHNTPDADREYVLYWEKMVKEMKWLENHVLKDFLEWEPMRRKGLYQSIKIANRFTNIHLDLACHGFEEYVWRTSLYRLFVEGLDRAFLEIWKRVNQMCFGDALQDVYNENVVPSRQHTLKAELERSSGFLQLERQFRRCTEGISKELPDRRVQELIAQEINYKRALPKTYAQYARKKLQVAELLGIIPRAEIAA